MTNGGNLKMGEKVLCSRGMILPSYINRQLGVYYTGPELAVRIDSSLS